jgi:hypothetical protein
MKKNERIKRKINDVASAGEDRALTVRGVNPSAPALPKGKPCSGNIVILNKGKWYPKAYLRVFRIPQKVTAKEQDWVQGYIAVPKATNTIQPPMVCFGLKKIDEKINLVFNNIEELLTTMINIYREIEKSAANILKAHLKETANWKKLNKKYLELYDIQQPFRCKSGKPPQLEFDFVYYDIINNNASCYTENTDIYITQRTQDTVLKKRKGVYRL